MSIGKVIEIARGELGYTEYPVNLTKYWQEYDPSFQGQPWCVAFLWWVFNHAGERMAFFGGGKTASCSTLLRWYKEQELTTNKQNVQVGDILILNFSGTIEPQHCGLVTHVERSGGSILYIKTIEGNTSSGDTSQDNGGMVREKVRYPRQVVDVCRPQYQPETVDDITGHWAENAIRRSISRGLMQGYPDGSFQPDKPVTRAEMAVILDRLEKEDDLK